jgi:hypothetical protein
MSVKKALNWILVIAGTLLGVLGLASFGLKNPSYAITDRWWLSYVAASALFAVVPLLGSTLAALNKRALAAVSFLVVVPLFARWAFLNAEFVPGLSSLYGWFAGICLVLGSYWLFVWWREWPPLCSRPLSARGRVVSCLVTLFAIAVLDLSATFALVVHPYSSSIDCGIPAVFSRSTFGHDAVFTAHLIRVGHQARISNSWAGTWAVAKVEERFWSWPLPRIVLLVAPEKGIFSDADYLVDGRRPIGWVTRFLPIVEIRPCCRTRRLPDAALELRLLRSGFPTTDVRIMGRVDRWVGKYSPSVPIKCVSVQGAQVEITGPQGILTATTDQEGIYEVAGLPPGRYQVRLPTGPGQESPVALADFPSNLNAGQVAEYSFSFRRAALGEN